MALAGQCKEQINQGSFKVLDVLLNFGKGQHSWLFLPTESVFEGRRMFEDAVQVCNRTSGC